MRRKFCALVLVLVALVMVQRPAYAMTARIPWGDVSGDWAYCAGKHLDAYSAAAELAGYDLSSLTQEQRTALLDKNGDYVAFGQLAERLTTLAQVADDFGGAITSFFNANGWFELMGLDEIWVYRASNDDLIEQAGLDIQECIAEHPRATGNPDPGGGGSGGSGGGTGNGAPPQSITLNHVYGSFEGNTVTVSFGDSIYQEMLTKYETYPYWICSVTYDLTNTRNNYSVYMNFYKNDISSNIQVGPSTNTSNSNLNVNVVYNSTGSGGGYSYGNTFYSGGFVTSFDMTTDSANFGGMSGNFTAFAYATKSDSTTPPYTPTLPQYPDNDIPDPTNIMLPDVTLPNITLPNLNPPSTQPSNPTYNTYTYNTYNTATGEDVIPYLRNIIEWLSEIDLDIVSGLNALGDIMDGVNTQIRQQVKWLFDSLDVELDAGVTAINTTIRTMIDGLAGLINDAFEDSFYDLKVWLKDALTKIKNEVSDFDDDMMYQLKLIRRKMGGGRSSEPSAKDEPDDWLKWWSDLISKLLEKLAEALPDELLELVEDFKALGQKFPFSIPWDIAFLVGLFAHAPVTPVFDYPVPYGYQNGALLVANVHVDLSPWDNVAQAIRNTQLVGFAIWLAFNTTKLSAYLKLPGSKGE